MPRKSPAKPSPSARLEKYRGKRDFKKTPEPTSGAAAKGGNSYVIQEHHARSHHFDFRLEMDGVLVSWAVPKGIPEETSSKRLAVHVEDHPLDYGSFEGEIPKGNYGAGKVAIWDAGVWEPMDKGWKKSFGKGKLKFRLKGRRLDGNYLLARMGEEPNWLLRRIEDSAPDEGAPLAAEEPGFVEPQLAKVVSSVPTGKDWCHEIKLDGYRIIAAKRKGKVTLFTRSGHDWSDRFGPLPERISEISKSDFVIDGEAVVFDAKGHSDFGGLQEALKESPEKISFVVFDLLNLGGKNMRELPLRARAEQLAALVGEGTETIRLSKVWKAEEGKELFLQACRTGLEGIISKRLGIRYVPGSRGDWVKSKCRSRQEFVICGYTPPRGSREGFGALLLASHDNGKLVPRGKVGTGFTARRISGLMERFKKFKTGKPLFETSEKHVTWLRPELVAEIEFAELTRDGSIRQGSFLGLREDKPARAVKLESLAPAEDPVVLGHTVSSPDRVVFPSLGITKLEVAKYFSQVGELMLPYVADRPLAVLRAPEGTAGQMFFQKSFTKHVPDGVMTATLPDGTETFYVRDAAGLVSLAQYGVIEVHPWGSAMDKPDAAEFLTWDLDPDDAVKWKEVLGAAFLLRDTLRDLGLDPMVKLSGGKGLHIMLRIRRDHDWEVLKPFTKGISAKVASLNPSRFIITASKAKRKNKIFIDWMRNGKGATCIAPWGLRARDGATVSMPVEWDDLSEVPPQGFNIHEPPIAPEEWLNPPAQRITKSMLAAAARFAG